MGFLSTVTSDDVFDAMRYTCLGRPMSWQRRSRHLLRCLLPPVTFLATPLRSILRWWRTTQAFRPLRQRKRVAFEQRTRWFFWCGRRDYGTRCIIPVLSLNFWHCSRWYPWIFLPRTQWTKERAEQLFVVVSWTLLTAESVVIRTFAYELMFSGYVSLFCTRSSLMFYWLIGKSFLYWCPITFQQL